MQLTAEVFARAIGSTVERAEVFVDHLNAALAVYEINTTARLAAFIAQIGHESGSLKWTAEIWGPTPAQRRYEGRADLGNTQPGDGKRFLGRGLIQTTGRFNHAAVRDRLRARGIECPDFEAEPEKLQEPKWASWSACDYWDWKKLNPLADRDDFRRITLRINGGTNGLKDRELRWEKARMVLAAERLLPAPIETIKVTPEKEMPLSTIATMVIPSLIEAVPELVRTWGKDGEKAEKNAKTVEMVLDVAKAVTGAQNEQAVMEIIQEDPDAAAAVREAVQADWFKIFKTHEESVDRAREHTATYSQMKDVRVVVGNFTFIEFLTLVFLVTCWSAIGLLAWGNKISEGTLDNIVMIAVVASIVGIREFWYGSSMGSRQKDERKSNETM